MCIYNSSSARDAVVCLSSLTLLCSIYTTRATYNLHFLNYAGSSWRCHLMPVKYSQIPIDCVWCHCFHKSSFCSLHKDDNGIIFKVLHFKICLYLKKEIWCAWHFTLNIYFNNTTWPYFCHHLLISKKTLNQLFSNLKHVDNITVWINPFKSM